MPQLGETVTEGTITKWFKAVGRPGRPRRAALRGVHRQGRLRGALAGRGRPDRDPGAGGRHRRGRGHPGRHRRRRRRRTARLPARPRSRLRRLPQAAPTHGGHRRPPPAPAATESPAAAPRLRRRRHGSAPVTRAGTGPIRRQRERRRAASSRRWCGSCSASTASTRPRSGAPALGGRITRGDVEAVIAEDGPRCAVPTPPPLRPACRASPTGGAPVRPRHGARRRRRR